MYSKGHFVSTESFQAIFSIAEVLLVLLGPSCKEGQNFPRKFRCGLSSPVRDTPPYRAISFRDSIAEGGIAPISLVFIGYRASISEIPLLGGITHLHFACSPLRKRSEKGEGVSHPIGHVETPKTHSAQ